MKQKCQSSLFLFFFSQKQQQKKHRKSKTYSRSISTLYLVLYILYISTQENQ